MDAANYCCRSTYRPATLIRQNPVFPKSFVVILFGAESSFFRLSTQNYSAETITAIAEKTEYLFQETLAAAYSVVETEINKEMAQAPEKHHTPSQLAKLWNMHPSTIRRVFGDMPGVLKFRVTGKACKKSKRVTIRIPESVAKEWYQKNIQ